MKKWKIKKWFKYLLIAIPIITYIETLYLTKDFRLSYTLAVIPAMVPATLFNFNHM